MGLEGCFLLHDPVELGLDLLGRILSGNPQNDPPLPGELPFDLPLVIQDRAFQLVYNPFASRGFLGDMFLVNGAIQPRVRVANCKYRFRILNGSNARFYHLALRTDKGNTIHFDVVGSDGGLYSTAVEAPDDFRIAPAERVEVIVDFCSFTPGPTTKVFLNNCLAQTDGPKPAGLVANCTNVPQTPGPDAVGSICSFLFSVPKDPSSFTPGQTLRTDTPVFNEGPVASVQGATRDWRFERGRGGEWLINSSNGNGALPFPPDPLRPRREAAY